MDRRLFIVIAVVGFHGLALWALQAGLLRRAVELVVPVAVLSELIEPPQPQVLPEPPQPKPQPALTSKDLTPLRPAPKPPEPAQPQSRQEPLPITLASPAPSESAPTGLAETQRIPAAVQVEATAVEASTKTAAAEPRKTFPSADIDPRFRPKPVYPGSSHRLGEQGVVQLKVLVSKEGRPLAIQVIESSGYARLDQAAEQTIKNRWRFTPGTVNGVPVEMEVTVPVRFSLDP